MKLFSQIVERDRAIMIVHLVDHVKQSLIPKSNTIESLHRVHIPLKNIGNQSGCSRFHQFVSIRKAVFLLIKKKKKHAFSSRVFTALETDWIDHGGQMRNAHLHEVAEPDFHGKTQ